MVEGTQQQEKKKNVTSTGKWRIRAFLLVVAVLVIAAAGCSRKESTGSPTPAPTTTIVALSEAKAGDTVQYGSYEQDNDLSNGAEAIEWLVVDKQDGKLLLLSKEALDCKSYNEKREYVTWETCTLRSWLNGEFYNTAFSQTEQGRILTTQVKNEDSPYFGTEGGNDTEDKIFLLSIEEALNYFEPDPRMDDRDRRAKATEYAKAQGAWVDTSRTCAGNGRWWLRSPGQFSDVAAYVLYDGYISQYGGSVWADDAVVRPALWLDPES